MADELRMALLELLRKAELEEDADSLRDRRAGLPAGRQVLSQALMELAQHLRVERHERTAERGTAKPRRPTKAS